MEERQQIIWYLTNNDPDTWKQGIVVGCDPDIGITIIDKAYPNIYVCCMIGPSAPQWSKRVFTPIEEQRMLDEIFKPTYKLWSGMIANGFWNSQIDDIQGAALSDQASAQTCPFGQ